MKKMMLLVPLCICLIAGVVMSGCGTSDFLDIPASITSLTLTGTSGDIQFEFKYIDNPDVSGTFSVQYALATAPDAWIPATVVNSIGDAATLSGHGPGDKIFYWKTVSATPEVVNGAYIFKVRVDSADALLDLPGTNMDNITINNI